jgi:hypothetical protein
MNKLYLAVKTKVTEWGAGNCLAALLVLLALLLVLQGPRYVLARFGLRGLAENIRVNLDSAGAAERKPLAEYNTILDKGLLGKGHSNQPSGQTLFGILGNQALIGMSPNDAKTYDVGADLPGGEKIVEINVATVVLEKNGNKNTLSVFPDPGAPGSPSPPSPPADQAQASPPAPNPPDSAHPQNPGPEEKKPHP